MSACSTNNVEQYSYKVIQTINNVEVRLYENALFSKTIIAKGDYKDVSSNGFRILAGYIFGDNANEEKIAMTSPVVMDLEHEKSMMFMIPKNMKLEDMPKPNSDKIEFVELPNRKLAAITFSGYADDDKINKYKSELTKTLKDNNIEHKGNFSFFGYNPPYLNV